MAKLSADGKYVTVEYGDTLGAIAQDYNDGYSTYMALAKANGISNPNIIHVGQKIYLTKGSSGGSSSSTPTTTTTNQNKVTNVQLGLLSSDDKTLCVTWAWGKPKQTEKYRVKWTYVTENGLTFTSINDSSVDQDYPDAARVATFSIPENAEKISVQILPVSLEYSTVTTKIVNGLVETTTTKKQSPQSKSTTTTSTVVTTYWTAVWSDEKTFYTKNLPPEAFEAPSIELNDLTLTATLDQIDMTKTTATHVEFRVVQNNKLIYNSGGQNKLPLEKVGDNNYGRASFSCKVASGAEYKVTCRAWVGSLYSDWSQYSETVKTKPNAPKGFVDIRATSEDSIYLKWDAVPAADSYEIEYATEKDDFDITSNTQTITVENSTEWEITDLTKGHEYFFRIRACNGSDSTNQSEWSEIYSQIIGTKPSAPTTWSSSTKAIVGEPIVLYWVHNSTDGSWQTKANLDIIVGDFKDMYELSGPGHYSIDKDGVLSLVDEFEDDDDKYNTCSCTIDTTGSRYKDGLELKWLMRTAGVLGDFGEWSTTRTIDIHSAPHFTDFTLSTDENSVLHSYPLTINGLVAEYKTQAPLGFHVSILANSTYDTVDNLGNDKTVSAGEEIFSRYYDSFNPFPITLQPSDLSLESSMSYTLICTAAMNSGLTATATVEFTTEWAEETYIPNAEISVNMDTYIATIKPFCKKYTKRFYSLKSEENKFVVDSELDASKLDDVYTASGELVQYGLDANGLIRYYCLRYVDANYKPITPAYYGVTVTYNQETKVYVYTTDDTTIDISTIKSDLTTSGEEVILGRYDGLDTFYCIREAEELVNNILLSVYRREFDGSFTEIETGISNLANTAVTDPHPALDYARYRIVATHQDTGVVSYYDPPGHPVGGKSIVLQWDEEWTDFNTTNEDDKKRPLWSGSLLEFRYNIDVDNQHKKEVTTVKYIGREHPVPYYGTQLGETSKWSAVIDKRDVDTIYALRRLSKWMGNVYVREPSGVGYWATLSVTFPIAHLSLTIPVSFDITRVEGGV